MANSRFSYKTEVRFRLSGIWYDDIHTQLYPYQILLNVSIQILDWAYAHIWIGGV